MTRPTTTLPGLPAAGGGVAARAYVPGWWALICLALAVLPVAGLAMMVAMGPPQLRYDEPFHLANVRLARTNGWIGMLRSAGNASATGPLFAVVHAVAAPITALRAPAVRWVNVACLVLTVLLLGRFRDSLCRPRLGWAAALLAVPFMWPVCGLALTELPALLGFCLFLVFLWPALDRGGGSGAGPRALVAAAGAGVALGVAILGRQTYLVAVPCLACMVLWHRGTAAVAGVAAVVALLVSAWLFVVWGGFVPPAQVQVASGLRLDHGWFSCAHFGVAAAILAPRWLRPRSLTEAVGVVAAGLVMSVVPGVSDWVPCRSLLVRVLGGATGHLVGRGIACAMGIAGVGFLLALGREMRAGARDPGVLFASLTVASLALAPVAISHTFSSRYVVGGIPALALLACRTAPSLAWEVFRTVAGSVVGAGILASYYW